MDRRQFLKGAAVGASGGVAVTVGGVAATRYMSQDRWATSMWQDLVPAREHLSYSAMGEDLILNALLRDTLRIATPTYLDIGAADPVAASNTYLLYTQGSRGVLVEPNPTYVARLRAARPRDVVIGAGVGTGEATEADYYVIKGKPMLNTFSPETAEWRRQNGEVVERVVRMPLVPLMQVIDENFQAAPDLISIDAEGMDLAIVQTLDLAKYRPAVICAETKGPAFTHESTLLATFLATKGYIVTAGTLYNTVLVDRARLV